MMKTNKTSMENLFFTDLRYSDDPFAYLYAVNENENILANCSIFADHVTDTIMFDYDRIDADGSGPAEEERAEEGTGLILLDDDIDVLSYEQQNAINNALWEGGFIEQYYQRINYRKIFGVNAIVENGFQIDPQHRTLRFKVWSVIWDHARKQYAYDQDTYSIIYALSGGVPHLLHKTLSYISGNEDFANCLKTQNFGVEKLLIAKIMQLLSIRTYVQ